MKFANGHDSGKEGTDELAQGHRNAEKKIGRERAVIATGRVSVKARAAAT